MIYAERLRNDDDEVLEQGVFWSMEELARYDHAARKDGERWTGSLETNIALNRYRQNRCMYCGVAVGEFHVNCRPPNVSREPLPAAAEGGAE